MGASQRKYLRVAIPVRGAPGKETTCGSHAFRRPWRGWRNRADDHVMHTSSNKAGTFAIMIPYCTETQQEKSCEVNDWAKAFLPSSGAVLFCS